MQVTGSKSDSSVVDLFFRTLKKMKTFADFDSKIEKKHTAIAPPPASAPEVPKALHVPEGNGLGLNLSYTINLNLPATSDQAVFNAIFRSLKES